MSDKPSACPTCRGLGPDTFEINAETRAIEAECGDIWHDRFVTDKPMSERATVEELRRAAHGPKYAAERQEFDCPHCGQDLGLPADVHDRIDALARRLLEERDEAVENANALVQVGQKYLAQLHEADKHAEALCELTRVALTKEYGERIASLERELEEAKIKALEDAAKYLDSTFGRCNLLTANGYLNGDDVAEKIRALKPKP